MRDLMRRLSLERTADDAPTATEETDLATDLEALESRLAELRTL